MLEQPSARQRRGERWVPVLLLVLALFDLRIELMLLRDHITLTALSNAARHHLLAVVVLAMMPSLWRCYKPLQKR
ncbi:MAG: hypothetical protein ACON4T_07160 [Synechococcus sp.]